MATITTAIPARLTAATVAHVRAAGERAKAQLEVDDLTAARAHLNTRIAVLVEVLKPVERSAWCADYTDNATGEVATLEIPGEDKALLIAPGALKPEPEDGALAAREAQSAEQVFFNAAILPGWQKFKPTYRRGTITAKNDIADTADVTLEATDKSSAQNLAINQTPTLAAVPVKYMSCNAGAFEVGDRCVIKFKDQDWAQPQVVGFVDNPKACGAALLVIRLTVVTYAQEYGRDGLTPWAYSVTSKTEYKRWIYRLHPTDPLDLSKARLEDYGQTTHDQALSGVSTTGPEVSSWQGLYTWGRTEVTGTVTPGPGGYGHPAGQVLLYSKRIITAAPSLRRAYYELDNYRAEFRYYAKNETTTAEWRTPGWSRSMTEAMAGAGYDYDYARGEPTPPPYTQTATGNVTQGGAWVLAPAGDTAPGPSLVFRLSTRPLGAGSTPVSIGPHTLTVGANADPAPAPALAPMGSFPVRATPYSKQELGPVPSTGKIFVWGGNIYLRTGERIFFSYTGPSYTLALSENHLLDLAPTTGVLQLRLASGALAGTAMSLQAVPNAITPDTDIAAALLMPGAWTGSNTEGEAMMFKKSSTAQEERGERMVRAISVQMVYDSKEGVDATAGWPISAATPPGTPP